MINFLRYYVWASYRRKLLDRLLQKNVDVFHGIVLDIGGRDRGRFQKPKTAVTQWIFADIEEKFHPDMVLDVSNMPQVKGESIDVINVLEVFEHVKEPRSGIEECYRVLKKEGTIVISCPFLSAIHADPSDFQRWTEDRWRYELERVGFKVEMVVIMGRFFTLVAELGRVVIKSLPKILRPIFYSLFPIFDIVACFDRLNFIQAHPRLTKFHGGYFFIAKK